MIRAAVEDPRFVLAAAADPRCGPRAMFARNFGAKSYETFESLCGDRSLEAVYIASPHEFHAEQTICALEHGKDVIVEKPLALTLEDCDAIIATVKRTGRTVIVGHTHAFDPSILKIRELVSQSDFGSLGMVTTLNYTDFLYRPRRPEELETSRGGGIAFNQITHQIDMVRAIANANVRSLRANVGRLDDSRPTEGNSAVFLEFENGAAASLVYSGYDFFDSDGLHDWVAESGARKTQAHGGARRMLREDHRSETEKRFLLGYGSRTFPTASFRPPHFGLLIATFQRADVRVTPNGVAIFDENGEREISLKSDSIMPGHGNVLTAFWLAVREGKPCIHDALWGRETLAIVLGILESGRSRRELQMASFRHFYEESPLESASVSLLG
jgi:phthalate 4,5-cis-dihydrodiol dehydrogenase